MNNLTEVLQFVQKKGDFERGFGVLKIFGTTNQAICGGEDGSS